VCDWNSAQGNHNFRWYPAAHDSGSKTIFGQSGNFTWTDAVNLCVSHPLHPSFFVTKLWSYFIPTPPDAATQASLENIYTSSGFQIRPVVEAILLNPLLVQGDELVVWPAVYQAALLRSISRGIDTTAWSWLGAEAGQQLYYPPNVAGWDTSRWLDTGTLRARWEIANYIAMPSAPDPWPSNPANEYSASETAAEAYASAMAFWGNPGISVASQQAIASFAQNAMPSPMQTWEQSPYRAMRQNALRMLIATSPDMQAR
jgi:uncharacterized protein (DUF1800 family)